MCNEGPDAWKMENSGDDYRAMSTKRCVRVNAENPMGYKKTEKTQDKDKDKDQDQEKDKGHDKEKGEGEDSLGFPASAPRAVHF